MHVVSVSLGCSECRLHTSLNRTYLQPSERLLPGLVYLVLPSLACVSKSGQVLRALASDTPFLCVVFFHGVHIPVSARENQVIRIGPCARCGVFSGLVS